MAEKQAQSSGDTGSPPHHLFVTGRLAESALRQVLASINSSNRFHAEIAVLPISVAALASASWIGRHLAVAEHIDRVYVPGLCSGDLEALERQIGKPVVRGPADLRDLPDALGRGSSMPAEYHVHDIEIIAEINHAPRLSQAELVGAARALRASGADVIDIGCDPDGPWSGVEEAVRAVVGEGMRVSIDSLNRVEIEAAVRGGAELVLSVNSSNREAALDWGIEVVVIPDDPRQPETLDATLELLRMNNVRFRIDPILEPIAMGFSTSLGRYLDTRRRYPDAAMMMGIGNLTELTDADSAGINVLLLGFCQEQGIRSVLTTQVINWSRSSVQELVLARRLVHRAVSLGVPPKRLEPNLVLLRDPRLHEHGEATLAKLASQIKDPNFRIFAERGRLHIMNNAIHAVHEDPFELLKAVQETGKLDAAHAFYLGYEMAKAVTALTLGKNYVQDQALRWGFLSVPEKTHHATMNKRTGQDDATKT
ncbi:dihydropteroate synthase [soil metagenome]